MESSTKKKRGADRQITKDDDLENDTGDGEGNEGTTDGGFRKADKSILEKRRIVKAKRPTGGATSATASTTTVGTSKEGQEKVSTNPFASTVLVPSKDTGMNDSSKPKVFGASSGFAGFGSTKATTTTSAAGDGGGGFGSATAAKYKGFGTTVGSSSGFGFGGAAVAGAAAGSSSSGGATTKNLFDTSNMSPSFGFGTGIAATATSGTPSKSDTTDASGEANKDDAREKSSDGSPPSGPAAAADKPAARLPEQVKLTTGEESEEVLFEKRTKTFKLVDKTMEEDMSNDASTQEANAAAPSVPPSSATFSMTSSSKKDSEADDSPASADKAAETANGKNGEENTTTSSAAHATAKRTWQEVGVGPIKLLAGGRDKLRLVQRYQGKNPGDKPTKLLLNVPFWKEAKVLRQSDKYVQLTIPDTSEVATYCFKFKGDEEAAEFFDILMKQEANAKSLLAGAADGTTAEAEKAE